MSKLEEGPYEAGPYALRVIVADDDGELRGLLAAGLRGMGCEVCEAEDGSVLMSLLLRRAFRAPEHASVDLVLVDINMPGCTGLQVLADLSGRRWRPTIAVVTGNDDPDVHRQARELGAIAVLRKPVDLPQLRRLVAEQRLVVEQRAALSAAAGADDLGERADEQAAS